MVRHTDHLWFDVKPERPGPSPAPKLHATCDGGMKAKLT